MNETRCKINPEDVAAVRDWIRGIAGEPTEVRTGAVTAYRPHGDDAWIPEHLALQVSLFHVEHDDEGAEHRWAFTEVIHPQECDARDLEEQVSANFHSRRAAEGFLSGYAELFGWRVRQERYVKDGIELALEEAAVDEGRSQHFLLVRAPERDAHAVTLQGAPVRVTPLRESHAWHLWRLRSGEDVRA